jgi:tubulin-specific chaperone E
MLCSRTERGSVRLHFPALISLSIAGNNFHTFDTAHIGLSAFALSTVSTLILDNNAFTSLVPLCKSIMQVFPNMASLSLQHNRVSSLTDPESTAEESLPIYTSVTSVSLSHNAITTRTLISSLPQLFPNLTSLRVSGNPFFHKPSSSSAAHTDEAAFSLTLARLPSLKTLNYSPITDKDRMDGELYYLSVAGKEISQLSQRTGGFPTSEDLKTLRQTWNRYEELCAKYEIENVLGMLLVSASNSSTAAVGTPTADSAPQTHPTGTARSKYPPGTLGARLLTITFLLSDNNDNSNNKNSSTNQSHTITLALTLDIYRVKGLLLRARGREWNLRPLAFDLEILSLPNSNSNSNSDGAESGGGEVVNGNGYAHAEYEEIPDSTRRIGDWIPEGMRECVVRVRRRKEAVEGVAQRMDLQRLMVV